MATAIWPLENGKKTRNKKHRDRFRIFTLVFDFVCEEENCPLEALRVFFFSRNSHKKTSERSS